jgi:hypothetical protein
MIMTAIEDAEALVPWIEQNADALNWEPLDEVVQGAFAGPVPEDYIEGVPLLRFANTDVMAVPLLDAVLDPPIPRGKSICDITGTAMREPNTLWVPCGRSVVQVTMRNFERDLLSDCVGIELVWC